MPPLPGGSQRTLRAFNERQIVETLLQTLDGRGEPLTRAQVIANTGLSQATVASVVADLHRILVSRASAVTKGRPSTTLKIDPMAGVVLGVQLGHRQVRAVASDLTGSFLVDEVPRFEMVDVARQPRESLDWAADALLKLLHEIAGDVGPERVVGIGVSVGAAVDQEKGMVRPLAATRGWAQAWQSTRIKDELDERLGWGVPIRVENDANLGALAELTGGASIGRENALYVKWGHGLGAGIIIGGRLYRGAGIAGEFGHMPLVLAEHDLAQGGWPLRDARGENRACALCGQLCLESAVSIEALLDDLGTPSLSELIDAAESPSGTIALAGLERAANHLGRALGSVITLLNPETVVIGGAFNLKAYHLIRDSLRNGIESCTTDAAFRATRIVPGRLTGTASLRGALAIILRNELVEYLLGRSGLTESPMRIETAPVLFAAR